MESFSDLSFFTLLMKQGSLAAAAQEMGVTPPSVSKRLAALEARLGVRLLHRTTRRISLTPEGETAASSFAKATRPSAPGSWAQARARRRSRCAGR